MKGNEDMFPKDIQGLGKVACLDTVVDTGTSAPVSSRPYRHDPLKTEAIAAFVEDLEKNNLISKSTSPWSSPVLLVKKKSATPGTAPSWRFCVDYSRVNNLTSVLGYSPPLVAELVDKAAGL